MNNNKTLVLILFSLFSAVIFLFLLSSCATSVYRIAEIEQKSDRQRIVEYSYRLLGRKDLTSLGRDFRNDCSGFILGVFNHLGFRINLEGYYPTRKITKILYITLRDNGLIYRSEHPGIADVAFFRATIPGDRGITHIALVVDTDKDGTVMMLHYGSRGVTQLRMNLRKPSVYRNNNGKVLNDFLFKASTQGSNKRLSGELFYCFGDLLGYLKRKSNY